ncbi:MAG: glycine cleavage system protein GcvH [Acetobacterium sp.]
MSKAYCILPCNGLDKCAGNVSRLVALELSKEADYDLICPVLLNNNQSRYSKALEAKPLCVIDGCNTRCASKLAGKLDIAIKEKINVSEVAKEQGIKLGIELHENDEINGLLKKIIEKIMDDDTVQGASEFIAPELVIFDSFTKDKFIFKVPKSDYCFNENDCWVSVSGDLVRVGVTDFVQQNLSDILYVDLPEIGTAIEQFDELGSIESSKTVFEIISPVSGTIIAINGLLQDAPELINESPYQKGWLVELRLNNFEEDKELLLGFESYFELLKRKVEEING